MNATSQPDDRPGPGHNRPAPLTAGEITAYLDDELTGLANRRGVIVAALTADLAAHPRVDDDETLGRLAENVRMARTLADTAEDRRVEQKKPFLDGGRTVDGWFKRFHEPLNRALDPLQTVMNEYGRRKLARQRAAAEAERQRAEAEAQRLAEAAMAADTGDPGDGGLWDRAADAAEIADQAVKQASARPADMTRVTGMYGAIASMRSTWSWRVTDPARVPRQYLMVNPDAIKQAAKARDAAGRPVAVIPGIDWIEQTKVGIR